MSTDNITLFLSLDNFVYGVTTTALTFYPFNLINQMVVDTTYLFGIKTCKLLATSKRIEDIITLTTSSTIKPLFLQDDTICKMITTQNETDVSHAHCCCIDPNTILITTHDILQQRNNMLKEENAKLEHDLESFCKEFLEDYETFQLIEKTFESIQDADMMIQCDILMNDYVEEL
jgi:hypothetical protein